MRKLRRWIIGGLIGGFGMLALPLTGLLPHGVKQRVDAYHQFAARQSVTLRSLMIFPPDLTDRTRAARAAGHYELVCAACHGSPAAAPERLAQDLSPRPPLLARGEWRSAAHQFVVLRDGIGGSAMPKWPASGREDEIWDLVAFLRQTATLSAEDYRQIAGQGGCKDCHGPDGEGRDGIPRLDIQSPAYIAAALRAYRDGSRQSAVMMAAARRLSDDQIDALAAEFGHKLVLKADPEAPAAELATKGRPGADIPACLSCHGPEAREDYPRLIGQDPRYLQRQLQLWQDLGPDRGGFHAEVMAPIASQLSDQDIRALADWLGQAAR